MGKRSPLVPLALVREQKADEAARALAEAARQTVRAAAEKSAREAEKRSAEEKRQRTIAEEKAALGVGTLRVADLAQLGAWERRAEIDRANEDAKIRVATEAVTARAADEARSRSTVANAKADLEATELLLAQERRAAAAKEAAALEEAAEDAYAARPQRG